MAQVDSLEIQISASSKVAEQSLDSLVATLEKLRSQLGYSTESAKKFGNSSTYFNNLNNSLKSSTKHTRSLASMFGKFYANFFLVVRGMKSLWSSIESTADYVEAFNYYTVSFGKVASKWDEDWEKYGDENAKNYGNAFVKELNTTFEKLSGVSFDPKTGLLSSTGLKNLGLNLQEVTQYAAQLGSMMDAVGQSGQTTLATTNAFVKLAGDISSLYNIDYSSAASSLRSVLQGQSRAGYKFGWDTTMASLQATADKLDLSKAVSEMSQMEKQQLRILVILEQSRVAWGDQSNTIKTLANQIRMFKNNLKEAGMILGQLFVPLMQKIIPIVNGVTIAIKDMLSSLATLFGIKIEDTGQGFTEMEDDLTGIEDGFDSATESAKKFKSQLQGFDKLNVLSTSTSGTAGSLNNTIDLTQQILEATKEYESVWNAAYEKMENKAQQWAKTIEKSFGNVKKLFKDISVGDWFAVGQDVSNLVSGLFDYFSKAIEKVNWKKLGQNIGRFLHGVDWKKVLRSVGNFLTKLWDAAVDLFSESFAAAPFETALLTALGLLTFTPLGTFLATNIANSWTTAMGTKAISDTVAAGLSSSLGSEAAKSALVFQANSLGTLFANTFVGALGIISAWFKKNAEDEEWELREKVAEYQSQGYDKSTARDKAAAESGNKYFDKVGLYSYDVETAQAKVEYEQGEMLRKFLKKLGSGFEDIFENMKSNPLWYMGYATGGFPEDGWFRASHGEYFGKFDDGTSVIANNKQIIGGIANGVRDANAEQNALLREQNQLLRQILEKDTGISSRDVFNAVRSENKAYINRNGVSALA